MIVKNESKTLKRCLDSVKGIIDAWCIVDTGSTDNTKDIIRNELKGIKGKLIERPWVNFGYNRSETYESAKEMGDWVILLDADHVLEDNGFNPSLLDEKFTHYQIEQKSTHLTYQNIRVLNTKKDWKCVGVTHEFWDLHNQIGERLKTLSIIDLGDGGSKSNKFQRDIDLLTKGLMSEPNNVRYKFYIAQSYKDLGVYTVAHDWYDKCSSESQWEEEVWYCEYMKAYCMFMNGCVIENLETQVMKAWLLRPWRIEPVFMLSKVFKDRDWIKCYHLLKLCLGVSYPKDDVLFIEHQLYHDVVIDELSVAAYWINNKKESLYLMKRLLNTEYGTKVKVRLLKNIELVNESISKNT